ncbi:MAG: hypothetical protein FD135_4739 [Comamonadaceae bacterium]|nr:MAG: hypothetical protein FD135_4739 [Comamonadaceae bacterium]
MAQGRPGALAHGHEGVQRGLGAGQASLLRQALQQAGLAQGGQIQHLVANGHRTAKGLIAGAAAQHGKGQVLDREICAAGVGGFKPAFNQGVVGGVALHHGKVFRRSSKMATARVQPAEAARILCGKHEM